MDKPSRTTTTSSNIKIANWMADDIEIILFKIMGLYQDERVYRRYGFNSRYIKTEGWIEEIVSIRGILGRNWTSTIYITSGMLHWNWNIPIRMKHNRLIGGA